MITDIEGYEGLYGIDINSNVYSYNYRHQGVTRRLKPLLNNCGYYMVDLHKNGKSEKLAIHRLMLLTFVGKCPEGHQARHLNGDKTNNSISNLAWGTVKENAEDRMQHGTHVTHNKKVSAQDIVDFKWLKSQGIKQYEIAAMYGIHESTASKYIDN